MTPRRQRMVFIGVVLAGVAIAVGLALQAFQGNLLYFFSPSQVVAGEAPAAQNFRIGGMVVEDSVERQADGVTVYFEVTDFVQKVPVRYSGLLPDLFREGQGVVAIGRLNGDGEFRAEEVLAKHDENYMPPEVAEALEMAKEGGAMGAEGG